MDVKSWGKSVFAAAAMVFIAAAGFAQVPTSQHVVLVIDENSTYSDVTANMPWLVGEGDANGYASNYQSDNGGSLLDYLWLASGSCHSKANCTLPSGTHDFNCNGNDCYYPGTTNTDPITDDNIFRELNNAGISWKVYAQSYKAAGGTVTTPDNHNGTSYYRRHNGATWYSDILSNVSGSAGKIVDLSQLATDIANGKLPRFAIIVPDGNHDAHDCPVGMSSCSLSEKLVAADGFLRSTLVPLLSTSDFLPGGDGLLIVTFDECGAGTDGGCGSSVYTALIGPKVTPHTVSTTRYKHENTLRTMMDSLGVKHYPGASATAADMSDFFKKTTTNPVVTVSSPTGGSSGSPVPLKASAVPGTGYSITGWEVYVDNASVYSDGAATAIAPNLSVNNGTHTMLVRAWDSSGAYGDQTFSLNVSASKTTVSVSTPANHATVSSSVNIKASASPSSGNTITGWWIYVDSVGKYNTGAVNTINATVSMSVGTHTVVVRAWDTTGAYADQTLTLTVSKSSKPTVSISKPASGASAESPIAVKASATPSSGYSITGWKVYVDGNSLYTGGAVNSISPSITASEGSHTMVVRAWDTSGAYGDQTITVIVP